MLYLASYVRVQTWNYSGLDKTETFNQAKQPIQLLNHSRKICLGSLKLRHWNSAILPHSAGHKIYGINRAEMTTISWWECTHTVGSALSGRVSIKIIINKRQQDSAFSRAQGARTLEARVCHSKKFSLRVGINALEMATKLIINNSLGRWINQGWSPSWATTICLYACVVT